MSDRPYSRLYWEVMDDPKFDGVREDHRHFGAWALMLVVADMAWPASAYLPPVSKASLALLVKNELVDVLPGGRYRIHGLNRERSERSEKARTAVAHRYNARNNARSSKPVLAENETRRDEDDARDAMTDAITYVEARTRRPFSFGLGSKPWETLTADVRDLGWPAVKAAMEKVKEPFPDAGQLIFGATRHLHPIAKPDPHQEAAERSTAAFDRGVAATQREIARTTGRSA